jgi:gamma-glutamylcyclotransferase (GGCT)/AIG2-like uncharacterized protein YtfP
MEKIFVYGTLRPKGESATHTISGFCLHKYSWFPFVKEGDGTVRGNIKLVRPEELPGLDRYEGVPNRLYKRIKVNAKEIASDVETEAWIYVPDTMLDNDTRQYPVINSGDWFKQNGE